jgi:hypothetical protein
VRGFIYDVDTGRLQEVKVSPPAPTHALEAAEHAAT